MTSRDEDLAQRLERFLDRRSVPMNLDGEAKAQARADEVLSLLRAVLRHAPATGYEEWWGRMEDHIAEHARGRGWPTLAEVAEAARALRDARQALERDRPRREGGAGKPWKPDPIAIDERRILAGEPVGDHRLWGRGADELLALGVVRLSDLDPYREWQRREWRALHGEEEAERQEREKVTGRPQLAGFFEPSRLKDGLRRMPGADPGPRYQAEDVPEGPPSRRYGEPTSEQVRAARIAAGLIPPDDTHGMERVEAG